jgi:hypothetical protein
MCADVAMQNGCQSIYPYLSGTNATIQWVPPQPLSVGQHFMRFTIADRAGNTTTSPLSKPYELDINTGPGTAPKILGTSPNEEQVVRGSCGTDPSSCGPPVSFTFTDDDGQWDVTCGGLSLQIYYMQSQLVYDYDSSLGCAPIASNVVPPAGYGSLSGWTFTANGFNTHLSLPGLYEATATVTDNEGHSASESWFWVWVVGA